MAIDTSATTAQASFGIGALVPQGQRPPEPPPQTPTQQEGLIPAGPRPVALQAGDTDAFNQADDFRQQQNSGFERQRNNRGSRAIQAYQTLARDERRQEVQQLLGVDTFA